MQNIWTSILPAIATSMIAATGSAVRAAAQDQNQAPAGDSPFAILLAALSAPGTPSGEGADADASSDASMPALPRNDQVGQADKPVPAASVKSNAADHVSEAALAALLNTTAAPPPFSPPAPEAAADASAPAAALADNDEANPASTGIDPQPDTTTPRDPAAPSDIGALSDPARPATPPDSSGNAQSDSGIVDPSTTDASTDPVLIALASDPAAPLPVSSGKSSPKPRAAEPSDTHADPAGKAHPEKKSAAPAQTETGATPALIADAYAGPAGQASIDQVTNPAAAAGMSQGQSAGATPGVGAKPVMDAAATGPAIAILSGSGDTDEPAAANAPLENAGPIAATPPAKTAAAPAKSTASAKLAANTQTATDAPAAQSSGKPQIVPAAHAGPGAHAAVSKTDAPAPSDDNAKLVQADPAANTVPAAAGATTHAALSLPAAIPDPPAIAAPHAAAASLPGVSTSASLEITSASSDPSPDLNGFAVSIAARSLSGAKQFEIRLDPPELGRVDVRLSIDAAGRTVAHMATDQPQTLDLLRKDAPALTQALRDAGLDVSQNGLNFSLRGQDRQNGDSQSGTQGRRSSLSARLAIQAAQAPAAFAYAGAASNARLDIHV